jgi:N-acetylmuramoyl-L-alanine amidase
VQLRGAILLGLLCACAMPRTAWSQNRRATTSYVVSAGDTLWSISRRLGVTVEALRTANGLGERSLLQVGATLVEPTRAGRRFDALLTANRRVTPRRWRYIVVHHTASSAGSIDTIDAFHRLIRHMPRGLAYHYLVGNGHGMGDGEIEAGSRWLRQQPGAHVASALQTPDGQGLMDEVAIGICLVGNFDTVEPSAAQLEALRGLISALQSRFHIPRDHVLGHREVEGAHTDCPGTRFPMDVLREAAAP